MKKTLMSGLVLLLGAVLWAADKPDGSAPAPDKKSPEQADSARDYEIALIKNVFKKMEEATAKEDVNAYLGLFSRRVEIITPDGAKLSYEDIKEYLVDLFASYDFIKDEQVGELDIRIKDNTAEVINSYRMSGIPKDGKAVEIFDEGALKMTLQKLPSFSPKVPPTYQIIAVDYLAADAKSPAVSAEDKASLLGKIKDNYGVDLEASGGFDRYRELLLQELKAENNANKEELEARIAILKKRLQKTFSASVKKEIQNEILELENNLGALTADSEIVSVVDTEIADLKEVFLRNDSGVPTPSGKK
jgi:hypothetical protein